MTENKIGGILLAAGGSTRFGSPKQLALYEGKTLLGRSAEAIANSGCSPRVVVLGGCVDDCMKELEGLDLRPVINSEWQTGMSSSITTGLSALLDLEPEIDAVLITLMDQPLVDAASLRLIVDGFRDLKGPIIAAGYGDTIGVPALFSREMFPELASLSGDKGARQIIRAYAGRLRTITMSQAALDIDTPGDIT